MTCTRCAGLLHVERIRGRRWEPAVTLWACYGCGDRTDETILWARRQAREAGLARQWKERVWQEVVALARQGVSS